MYQIFTCFIVIPYLQDHPLHKNQATKFPAILDIFYLVLSVSSEFQHGQVVEARGGQDGGSKILKRDELDQDMGNPGL